MKVSERLAVVDRIGRELQARFSYEEINHYLAAFGIAPPGNVGVNSKWVYVKAALAGVDLSIIGKIVDDLELGELAHFSAQANPPENWKGVSGFRLFISHVAKDKDKATRLKECLAPYNIIGFVAHEDINPTLRWQDEIERALATMDAMVAVHTAGFSGSTWTQQEIGFALGRGTKIISFRMGEDPTGFISKRQALSRQGRRAEDVAKEIDALLARDPLTASRLAEAHAALKAVKGIDDELPF